MTEHNDADGQNQGESDHTDAHLTIKNGQVFVIRDGVANPVPFSSDVKANDLVVANPSA
ncbi:hypothetical protein [Enterovibrio nigricans]|uniref:Uncharacterized protein n=1 Tax=Enterovibrio nigricans DSM 22720 TaxID=1121868 RepID=A0A1T4UR07_9GAMM|nr:hypothetical protein [Enterovibrio nigricans]SKA55076.1 hypothetical protein SAMN02745132_02265 [Enterovibrio nigricans DSM 22720]